MSTVAAIQMTSGAEVEANLEQAHTLLEAAAGRGAQLFAVPAAFTATTGQAHWEVLLRARAIENLCAVIAAGQSGRHANGRETYGDSLVTDHWGRVLARQAQGPGVVTADFDLAAEQRDRERFPVLEHRVLG